MNTFLKIVAIIAGLVGYVIISSKTGNTNIIFNILWIIMLVGVIRLIDNKKE